MKAKQKAAKSRSAKKSARAERPAETPPPVEGEWRMSELPLHLQVELRDGIEQARRGEGLEDFDEAIADADRMSDEMLSIASRDPHRAAD